MSGPIHPVKEDAFANGLGERDFHRGPVGGARDPCGLVMRSERSLAMPGREKNRIGLTEGDAFEGALILPPLFKISHNAESTSVPSSRSPSKKLSIFLSRLISVAEPSVQTNASWLMYRVLISSYLRFSLSIW